MHIIVFVFISVISNNFVFCRNNVRKLTESMGQEVIELGGPIKDLPPGLEEEPSGENEEDTTSTTVQVATKENRKIVTTATANTSQTSGKDIDVTGTVIQEDDEARIEKELADIYKDNAEYKADSGEKEDSNSNLTASILSADLKPIGRKGDEFRFQPESNNKAAIEKFRTSVDEINCNRLTTKLNYQGERVITNIAYKIVVDVILLGATLIVMN